MKRYESLFLAFIYIISSCAVESSMPGDPTYVNSIAITNKINEIIVGQEYKFEAAYSPSNAEGFDKFTWQSSDNAIAIIDQTGLLEAVEEGEVIIKLTAQVKTKKGMTTKTDEVAIAVMPVHIQSIKLDRENLEILNHSTDTLTVSFVPSNAEPQEIEWMSSNESIVSVDSGIVYAKSVGNAIITAQVKGTNIKTTCNVKVTPLVVISMQFETEDVILESGFTFETKLIIDPDSAENKNVTYTSSNNLIAQVNANGVITGHYYRTDGLLGKGPVSATVTATSVATGVKATCNVEVYSVPDLVTMTVEKDALDANYLGWIKGYLKPTLHNNSSKPINIVRFRILDSQNNYDVSIPVGTVLKAYSSYTIEEWIYFKETDKPRAVFDFEFENIEYRITCYITR